MVAITIGAALLFCGALLHRHFAHIKTLDADGKTDKSLPPTKQQVQVVSDTARLESFFWNQSHSNADECFVFSFGAAQWDTEAKGHYLNCEFRATDGEFIDHRDVPVTQEQWSELEKKLRELSLPPYVPPDPDLLDAADSCLEICWTENGNRFTNRYNGEYAHELHTFLMTFIGQITK